MRKLDAFTVYLIMGSASAFLQSMIFTVLAVYYVTTVGMNPFQLVLVGTTLELTVFLFEAPTGVVADTYSRRLSVILGIALIGVCYLIEGWAPVFFVILLAEFIRGVGETFISGASTAWIVDELDERRVSAAFVRRQQVQLAGGLLGIAAGAALGAQWLSAPVWLGGLGLVLLALLLAVIMPEAKFQRTPDVERETWRSMVQITRDGLQVVWLQPIVLMFVLVAIVYGAFSEGFDRLWEAHYLTNVTMPAVGELPVVVWIGIIRAGSMLVGIVVSEGLMRRLDFADTRALSRVLLVTTALLMASVVSFGLAGGFVAATLVYWLAGGLRALQYPVAETWLNRNIPSKVRATVLSLVGQADAFGQIAGGPVVGVVGLRSLRAALVLSGLLLSPALVLYGKGVRLTESDEPSRQPD